MEKASHIPNHIFEDFTENGAGPHWTKSKTLLSPFTSELRANTNVLVTSLCWGASRRDLVATYKAHGVV